MAKKHTPNIEETFARLEAIVAQLESEQGDLKGSLDAFEQGVTQIKQAQQLLSEASQRVNQLVEGDRNDTQQGPEANDE